MRPFVFFSALLFFSVTCLWGNSDVRTWTFESGERISAELLRYDQQTERVTLRFNNVEEREYDATDFSLIDRAWLIDWNEFESDLEAQIQELGGRVEHRTVPGEWGTEVFIYYPSSHSDRGRLPALALFHPGGKAARYLKQHMEAAEACDMILVACGSFRNSNGVPGLGEELWARFPEVARFITHHPSIDPARIFLGGVSGGAARAYSYSAHFEYPWAGIYANGGWMGPRPGDDRPYARNMRVAIVNGDKDYPASRYVDRTVELLEARDALVGIFAFDGGHQVAPPRTQKKVFDWLLEQDAFED